jgi:bacterioferritin-associated ferredoxin
MSCKRAQPCYIQHRIIGVGRVVYVCNCNGIREREARAAIEAGAAKPADIFRHCQSAARCAKCVCDMRRMIGEAKEAFRYAAE